MPLQKAQPNQIVIFLATDILQSDTINFIIFEEEMGTAK